MELSNKQYDFELKSYENLKLLVFSSIFGKGASLKEKEDVLLISSLLSIF